MSQSEQDTELRRVAESISDVVLAFMRQIGVGGTFHSSDLREYVDASVAVAPESPSRIMRMLRKEGLVDYSVVSRSDSLYRVDALAGGRQLSLFPTEGP